AYKIIGGVKESSNFALLALASSIEVEKTETSLFLRVNGIRLPESEIIIATADRNKSFYGAIAVERGLTDAGFTLRYGGFSDTGNRIELSYACAAGFASSDEEKAVLVIDRSGTGEFNSSDLEYIPVSEVDVLRRKLVFHNVFFDRDGNGMDVFTFAYGKTESLGNLEVIPPTCGLVDGEFTLQLDWGVRGYNYVLKNLATGNTVSQGWEGSRNIHVTGLNTGNYELTVSEDGGYTFESDMASGALLRAKTTNFLPAIDGNIPFRVSNITETYTIGYTASTAEVGSASNIFHYGLKQSGNRLYKVENGKETLLSGVTLQTGDELKIEKGLISISYYRNGTKVGSSTIRLQDYGLSFYGLIDFGNGPAELLNVKAEGFFNLIDYRWNVTSGVTAVRAGNSSKKYAIEIPGCETKSTALPLPYAGDNMLQVSVIQGTRMLHVNLTLDVPSRVSLLVFDTKGLPVARQELAEPQTVQTATLQLPQAGVFIVKALTSDGREYGQKVRVN
ncbi:MAG: hypothetical protein LBD45_01690, partial [Bacteroidales bacterium]|nr:hypothetical protein [Bacteroidales bacterium]